VRHVIGLNKYFGLNKQALFAKTKWGLGWESILAHLNWEIKHMAPLEPMIVQLINTVNMIPCWGINHLKRWSFKKSRYSRSLVGFLIKHQ